MARVDSPLGQPFLVDSCEFMSGVEMDYAVLSLDEDKIFDWPMIYVLSNGNEAYIGQTTSVKRRMRQHGDNHEKQAFRRATVIFNEEFNMSVITDYESKLI